MECIINKAPNLFVVDIQKKENNISSSISSIVTTKLKPNSVGAANLKSAIDYHGDDAEVWVFVGGQAQI